MFDMMDLLHKDLIAIVYYYVYDDLYRSVKQQYRAVWLNTINNTNNKLFWDDDECTFGTRDVYVANYRVTEDAEMYFRFRGVNTFKGMVRTGNSHIGLKICRLPQRYFYSYIGISKETEQNGVV